MASVNTEDSVQLLVSLGFTPLEAEIYTFLALESPATGYRIAQALGRPVAGVYKSIDSLGNAGAILLDEGEPRHCRAVPVAELMARLQRSYSSKTAAAAAAMSGLGAAPRDDRVYQVRSLEQALERCRFMLDGCSSVALIDGFAGTLEALRPEIEAAAKRGVKVVVQTDQPEAFGKARVLLTDLHAPAGQRLILVADGAEHLVAFLDQDGGTLLQAVWSGSPYLSSLVHGLVMSRFVMAETMDDPAVPAPVKELIRKNSRSYPLESRSP